VLDRLGRLCWGGVFTDCEGLCEAPDAGLGGESWGRRRRRRHGEVR
jgi:hypothetical protein